MGGRFTAWARRHPWESLFLLVVIIGLIATAMRDDAEDAATQAADTSALTNTTSPAEPTSTPSQRPTKDGGGGSAVDDSAADTQPTESPKPKPPAVWTVVDVVDGDTIDVARGDRYETIRLVGIDSPESDECGYDAATAHLRQLLASGTVTLVNAGPNTDDRDRYDRLLRYVESAGVDAGYEQIAAGMAIARYDSRDGYGAHNREAEYIAADEATGEGYSCAAPEPEPVPEPAPEPEPAAQPWNQPGPDLDCADIGMRVRITGPDYHGLDADGDGWGCDSYG